LFTEFINNLRGTLASHHEPEDIFRDLPIENKKHPLLAKLRAEQQPARWIQIELKAVNGNKTSTITLVMRDDNVDVMGFKNQMGWFELGNWRMLPPQYNSVLLGCRVATNKEQVANMLCSKKLGKKFAVEAVCTLSCFTGAKDVDQLMQPLVGLSVMICDSARMNPVLGAIEKGWKNGAILTDQIMSDVWRYGEMSEALRQWKRGNYTEPRPTSELGAIYLVLNGDPFSACPFINLLFIVKGCTTDTTVTPFVLCISYILPPFPNQINLLKSCSKSNYLYLTKSLRKSTMSL